ncbi:hypothetical protein HU200_003854 [Digitaria exilis]|uniref:PUM-HD domain-containing protein n=1 Tax=Digitaria exilis TaxID=1010633 RepID=A0A835FVZ8_9POAL|nr:hypothetical protein HU200_003854 [Digitaria exilis]
MVPRWSDLSEIPSTSQNGNGTSALLRNLRAHPATHQLMRHDDDILALLLDRRRELMDPALLMSAESSGHVVKLLAEGDGLVRQSVLRIAKRVVHRLRKSREGNGVFVALLRACNESPRRSEELKDIMDAVCNGKGFLGSVVQDNLGRKALQELIKVVAREDYLRQRLIHALFVERAWEQSKGHVLLRHCFAALPYDHEGSEQFKVRIAERVGANIVELSVHEWGHYVVQACIVRPVHPQTLRLVLSASLDLHKDALEELVRGFLSSYVVAKLLTGGKQSFPEITTALARRIKTLLPVWLPQPGEHADRVPERVIARGAYGFVTVRFPSEGPKRLKPRVADPYHSARDVSHMSELLGPDPTARCLHSAASFSPRSPVPSRLHSSPSQAVLNLETGYCGDAMLRSRNSESIWVRFLSLGREPHSASAASSMPASTNRKRKGRCMVLAGAVYGLGSPWSLLLEHRGSIAEDSDLGQCGLFITNQLATSVSLVGDGKRNIDVGRMQKKFEGKKC